MFHKCFSNCVTIVAFCQCFFIDGHVIKVLFAWTIFGFFLLRAIPYCRLFHCVHSSLLVFKVSHRTTRNVIFPKKRSNRQFFARKTITSGFFVTITAGFVQIITFLLKALCQEWLITRWHRKCVLLRFYVRSFSLKSDHFSLWRHSLTSPLMICGNES